MAKRIRLSRAQWRHSLQQSMAIAQMLSHQVGLFGRQGNMVSCRGLDLSASTAVAFITNLYLQRCWVLTTAQRLLSSTCC